MVIRQDGRTTFQNDFPEQPVDGASGPRGSWGYEAAGLQGLRQPGLGGQSPWHEFHA